MSIQPVSDLTSLTPKRAYVLRSPAGEELLAVYGGPAEDGAGATFFAHAPGFDGEVIVLPSDGWSVLPEHAAAAESDG
ncbi:hypothetical protein ACRAWB_10975 [Leifsonia poae]|uniref:hypothetical protein n=1 Tax=Leifsonia poae TaxID=110933 RepID=UPI003D69FD96